MTTLEERALAALDPVATLVGSLSRLQAAASDIIAAVGRNEPVPTRAQLLLAGALDDALAAVEPYQATAGTRPPVDMLAVDLGAPTGHHPAVATMPVADVPVDGSVEVRPVTGSGRFGPWVHVIGEQQAVGGGDNRSLLVDGLVEPFTWHRDQCVQVRPFRPADEDLVDAMHRIETGGL